MGDGEMKNDEMKGSEMKGSERSCLLYTSDAADEL